MGCANHMEHIGNTKIRNAPTPKQKTIRPVGCMVTGPIDYQRFLSLSLGSWVHVPSTTNTPSQKILSAEMGWTSTLVSVGSLEFSTPSYLPITTFPLPPGFCCIAFFSPLSASFERNSSELVELCNATSFQVSSKFQAMCGFSFVFFWKFSKF
jgi:hypothetical protein